MAKKRRIPTPLSQHLNHFRTGVLPLIAFLACAWLTMFLWERRATQGTIVAEAEASTVEVASGVSGNLMNLRRDWRVWDEVGKNEIIAQFDKNLLEAEIEVVKANTQRLIADLEATRVRTEVDLKAYALDDKTFGQRFEQDSIDRAFQIARLAVQEKQVMVEMIRDHMESQTLKADLEFLNKAGNAAAKRDKVSLEKQIARLEASIKQNRELLYEIKDQIEALEALEKENESVANAASEEGSDVDSEVAGLIATMQQNIKRVVDAQDAEIKLLDLRIQNMTIRSPVAGVISSIHKRPGEAVREGDPIMTVVSDSAEYIVGYWREKHRVRPAVGLPVSVRLPQPDGIEFDCTIVETGPQYQQIPQHQLRDYGRPEYGLPVKIEIPDDLKNVVKPGELVHVIYRGAPVRSDNNQ